ncbi:hypothetical protein [Butyrivibrio sp. YAB3001]|uniref:hypothetical protein n=1 Tax=Butyrivibrio sp. YAB3001 TaxID=1520812 RepID=UPI0008F68728|nr:hypothetical protein [Butyrivibrio sp. YAB3001]SFC27581.1 hypothetical protein SAMN02910398_01875 [Butyrivibrio sp. YAB3001]
MEYKYQNSVDDFRVKYTLVIPDDAEAKNPLTEKEQKFLDDLNDAYDEIENLTNQADGYDYALAVSSGIIAGLIDSFWVGEWDFRKAKGKASEEIAKKIVAYAKKHSGYAKWCDGVDKTGKWIKRKPDSHISAVEFLEELYVLPGDTGWNFAGSGVSPTSHRLDDFCHHPTLVGMISCIIVQFTGTAKYHPSSGEIITLPVTVNKYGNFVSDKAFGKVFAGIINWFFNVAKTLKNRKGHLISDMAGSISSVKVGNDGAGIPGTVMSTLKELSALPCFQDTAFAENLRKAFQNGIGSGKSQLDLGVFNNLFDGASSKFDMRTELAIKKELKRQAIPVVINEIVVRAFFFIRRFIEQMRVKRSLMEIEWKRLLPVNNRTIVRMMTVASGTFCAVDIGDAAIRAGIESCGNVAAFGGKFILRVNFVGIGRFTIAVGADLYMAARKGRMELAIASGEVANTALLEKKIIQEVAEINDNTDTKIEKMKAATADVSNLKF